jgi:hypothetical protein
MNDELKARRLQFIVHRSYFILLRGFLAASRARVLTSGFKQNVQLQPFRARLAPASRAHEPESDERREAHIQSHGPQAL